MEQQFRADDAWTEASENAINKYRFKHDNGLVVDFNLQREPMSQLYVKTTESEVGFGCRFMGSSKIHTEKLKRCLKFPDDIYRRERDKEQQIIERIESIQSESDIVSGWRKTDDGGIVYVDSSGEDLNPYEDIEDHIEVEAEDPIDVF